MLKLQWEVVFCPLPQGVSHQITIFRPTPHREKADHVCVCIFYKSVGVRILWKGEEIS